MARSLPPSTPEGRLIRRVREGVRPRLSIPEAAKRAHVGEATWGNTERGYRPIGQGKPPAPFRPSAKILAHMAYALESVTPEDLVEAGRPDAAEVLAEMQIPELVAESFETDRGRMWVAVREDLSEERRALLRKWAEEMGESLYQEERSTGRQQPPDSGTDDR